MYWLARGEHELPSHDAWLTPDERARLAQLRYTKRRTEYLLRRWTAKQAVAAVYDLDVVDDLARIAVRNHPTGAPYVQVDGDLLGADISVTDRAGWAVCLVGAPAEDPGEQDAGTAPTPLSAVGVDLELVEPRSDGFIEDYLTAPERDYVRSWPDQDARYAAANLMWSAKEAALKVLRTGLRADTRTVEVTFDPAQRPDGWAALSVRSTRTGQVFPGWWRRDGRFVLTMAFDDAVPAPADPPRMLAQTANLASATPVHTWLTNPLAW